MKILVMGAGKMGSFFIDLLSFEHEVAVFERDAKRMRFTYNCQRFTTFEEIQDFKPELLINAVTLKYTIPVFKEVIPYLPKECIISDPSHIGGRRELIAPLCQQAMDLGFDGLIVESHCDPDKAWSDAKQQVTPDVLDYILSLLIIRDEHVTTEGIQQLRKQIDDLDNQLMDLLAKRMQVCRQIGEYKKEHNMTVLQASRYNEILEKRGVQGTLTGMAAEFVAKVFESIHEESVRQQIEIVNK